MKRNKGKPSGINKPDAKFTTGIPTDYSPANQRRDHQATRKYTSNDEKISDHIRPRHPNRNVDKTHPTNAGGYR